MLGLLFSPSGRIGRGKWWLLNLGLFICTVVVIFFFGLDLFIHLEDQPENISLTSILAVTLYLLVLIWVTFCITVKRYHDRGKSGWWYLIQYIPFVGPIWAFIELGFCAGDYGDNDYGDGPDMDIEDDLKALRALSGQQPVAAAAPAYRSAPAANTGGPPVFGKRG